MHEITVKRQLRASWRGGQAFDVFEARRTLDTERIQGGFPKPTSLIPFIKLLTGPRKTKSMLWAHCGRFLRYHLLPLLLCRLPFLLFFQRPQWAHGLDIVEEDEWLREIQGATYQLSIVRQAMQHAGFQVRAASVMTRRNAVDLDRPPLWSGSLPHLPVYDVRSPRPLRPPSSQHHAVSPELPSRNGIRWQYQELQYLVEEQRRLNQSRNAIPRPSFPPPDPPSQPAEDARDADAEHAESPHSAESTVRHDASENAVRQRRERRRYNALTVRSRDSLLLTRIRFSNQRCFGRGRLRHPAGSGPNTGGPRPGGAGLRQLRQQLTVRWQLFRLRCHGWTQQVSSQIRTRWEESNVMSQTATRVRTWFVERTTLWRRTWVPGQNPAAEAQELAVIPPAPTVLRQNEEPRQQLTGEETRNSTHTQREEVEDASREDAREGNDGSRASGNDERRNNAGRYDDHEVQEPQVTYPAGQGELNRRSQEENEEGGPCESPPMTTNTLTVACPPREPPHRALFRLCLGLWVSSYLVRRPMTI